MPPEELPGRAAASGQRRGRDTAAGQRKRYLTVAAVSSPSPVLPREGGSALRGRNKPRGGRMLGAAGAAGTAPAPLRGSCTELLT